MQEEATASVQNNTTEMCLRMKRLRMKCSAFRKGQIFHFLEIYKSEVLKQVRRQFTGLPNCGAPFHKHLPFVRIFWHTGHTEHYFDTPTRLAQDKINQVRVCAQNKITELL